MARPNFVCVDCGNEAQQSLRGIARKRCPECKRAAKIAYVTARRKNKQQQAA